MAEAATTLHGLARRFLEVRGDGAAWHVDELSEPLYDARPRDRRTHDEARPPATGRLGQEDGRTLAHVDVPAGVLTPDLADRMVADAGDEVVVTPWRSVLLPDLESA